MKRKMIAFLAAFILCTAFMATAAFADTAISVAGTGEVFVPADTAVVSLGVSVIREDVKSAQQEVNATIESIRTELLDAGIDEKDINTGHLSIYGEYDYTDEGMRLTGYNVSSILAIKVTEMEKVGEIIDRAFEGGANTLDGISFFASDTEEAEKEALKLAVADARSKADVLAEAIGSEITGVTYISNGTTSRYERGGAYAMMAKNDAVVEETAFGTYIQAVEISVSVSVQIDYTAE